MDTNNLCVALAAVLAAGWTGCHTTPDRELIDRRTRSLYGAASPDGDRPVDEPPAPPEAILEKADLDVYTRYGLHHNAGLRSAFERWQAGTERIEQVSSLPDPSFAFTQFVEDLQTRTGPQERRYQISQMLPWFGVLDLRGSVATEAAEELWQKVEQERLDVKRDIALAFHEYGYLAQSIRISGEVLELLRQLEPVVQRRIQGGAAGQEDLLRLQVEIGRVENDWASYQKVRPALSARLAAAMNWTGREVLPLPELAEPTPEDPGTRELLQRAEERNPRLRELGERIDKSASALDLAKLEKWPDVTLGFEYYETGSAVMPTRGSGDDPYAFRVMFDLPISRSRYAAAEREAARNLASAQYELADLRVTLRSDIELAAFQLGDAGRQVVLYHDTLLPRSREALEVTRASYRAGRASLLDLIDSERALLQFETAYWRACRDHFQSQARLEALVGGEMR